MPYIKINTNKSLTNKEEIKSMCGNIIELIPGKSENWLMVQINDQQDLYFKGQSIDCIKVDIQVYGSVSLDIQTNFINTLISQLSNLTQIDSNNIYVTFQEFEHWGLLGSYM